MSLVVLDSFFIFFLSFVFVFLTYEKKISFVGYKFSHQFHNLDEARFRNTKKEIKEKKTSKINTYGHANKLHGEQKQNDIHKYENNQK